VLRPCLNSLVRRTDSRVEQDPEVGECFVGCGEYSRALAQILGSCGRWSGVVPRQDGRPQRHEGKGAGDGVRLHGWNKALEGEPQERTDPQGSAGLERMKASRGCENLKAQGESGPGKPASGTDAPGW